eukprot:95511_1
MVTMIMNMLLLAATIVSGAKQPPNIVFIMGESVASSAYFFGQYAPMPLPNLQFLMQNGVSFPQTYAAAPVCNPSRATTITGRHAHKHLHRQLNPATGLMVNGTWNNHEGLDPRQNNTFFNFTQKYAGYQYGYFGKIDWTAGAHSLTNRVDSWCNKVNFPYTLDPVYDNGMGWHTQNGAVYSDKACNIPGPNCTQHGGDWQSAQQTADFITNAVKTNPNQPFLAYWGSRIVHPPYGTTDYWISQVNQSNIIAPEWQERDSMHPEDFQQSMKKGFFGSCCNDTYKKTIRAHYYANIAEYDAMIGVLINAVKQAGVIDNTWIIATSDHGDMKMEHTQFYKMVHYDSSSRVPSIIYAGNNFKINRNVIRNDVVSSMLDYFPTIMDIAGINWNKTTENVELDGNTLMSYMISNVSVDLSDQSVLEAKVYDDFNSVTDRPNYVMSQFHGEDIHLSWFLLRQNEYKYVVYGTGKEVSPRLYNLVDDADEMNDLYGDSEYDSKIKSMDETLRTIIDYPAVAENVEMYNKNSFVLWRASFANQTQYNETISTLNWKKSWEYDSNGCFIAIDEWLNTPNDTFFWAFP